MNWQPDFLNSEIVALIPLEESDFETLYNVASDPLIWEQHPAKNRYEREIFREFFDDALSGKSAFKIIDKVSGKVIGSTRFYDFDADLNQIAIGYTFLARQFWGGTYNKSVKNLMIDHAFNYVDTVLFHIGPTNFRSQNGTMKIGAKKIGEVFKNGSVSFEYAIEKASRKS